MGSTYTIRHGIATLDCVACGTTGHVRRRQCPVRSASGLPWCPAADLCSDCFKAERASGRWDAWHATCARRQLEEEGMPATA